MKRTNTPEFPPNGFTLIEVLAALVIVSIGMLAVIQAVSQAASNAAYLRDKSIAQWVALNQLTLIRVAAKPPTKGTNSGETEMAGQRWKWTVEVSTTAVDSMKRIDVRVRFADAEENSQLATVTGFYGDRIAKPGTLVAQYTPVPPSASPVPPNPGTPTNPVPGASPTPSPATPINPAVPVQPVR